MTALLLIDWQQGFDIEGFWGKERNNPGAEQKALSLIDWFRNEKWPVIHVRHGSTNGKSPLHHTHKGFAFKKGFEPLVGEIELVKSVNSAFIGTGLEKVLRDHTINNLVICGLTTDQCVSTSVRMSGNLGFNTILVEDACATFDKNGVGGEWFDADLIHRTAIASLNEEFAKVLTTESTFKWLQDAIEQ